MEPIEQSLTDLPTWRKIAEIASAKIMTLTSENDRMTAENLDLKAKVAAVGDKMRTEVAPKLAQLDKLPDLVAESAKTRTAFASLEALLAEKPLTEK